MFPNSPYFEISAMHAPTKGKALNDSKVASGMEVSFTIKFKPQEVKDYSVDLVVSTEREKFLVPVVAVGDRPLLQLPDDVSYLFLSFFIHRFLSVAVPHTTSSPSSNPFTHQNNIKIQFIQRLCSIHFPNFFYLGACDR